MEETSTQVFSCEFYENFKKNYFEKYLQTAVSEVRINQRLNMRKQVFCEKGVLKYFFKITGKHLYWSLLWDSWVHHDFLETYYKENFQMGFSVTTNTLHVLHKLSQRTRGPKGETRWALAEINCFILSNFSFKGTVLQII